MQSSIWNVYISNGYIPTAIFEMAIWNDYISNGHIPTAIFQTAMSFISIYTYSFTLFCKEPITSLLLPHNKMSRLYHLDSSSSSDDDDEPELTLGALHQAHTRYLAMHSSQWGALYLAGNIFIAIEKLDIGGCTMTIFQKLQHMMHLSCGAGMWNCLFSPRILNPSIWSSYIFLIIVPSTQV